MFDDSVQVRMITPEELTEELRQSIKDSSEPLLRCGGLLYADIGSAVLCCPDNPAGYALFEMVLRSKRSGAKQPDTPETLMRSILLDEHSNPDSVQFRKCRIKPDEKRCVAVLRSSVEQKQDLYTLFTSLAPAEKDDIAVSVDEQTVAVVKCMKNQTEEELAEYTEAVLGTMESEGITGINAGIGRVADHCSALRRSYCEALDAINIGLRYRCRNHVFNFAELGLERILDCIPPEQKKEIRQSMFGDFTSERLSDEMIETASVFFQNDLNLTAASRQLFVHRNTLNYRLDKIRKDFGLDLRSFSDAMVFKIVTGIPDEK